jgi:SAP domain-containing protein
LSSITHFAVRSSGRDIRLVRRPGRSRVATKDVASLKKDELVKLAEERGVDTSGTKAEITERLGTVTGV